MQELTEDQKKYVVDLMVMMTVQEIAEILHEDQIKVLHEFIPSATGKLLYDESSKLWWDGPASIAQMYLKEKYGKYEAVEGELHELY